MCSEVVEARTSNKKSCLSRFRGPAFGDSTGSIQIEKDRDGVPPGLVSQKGQKR